MKKVCIVINRSKDPDKRMELYLGHLLDEQEIKYEIVPEMSERNGKFCYIDPGDIPDDAECVMVLGGDGTIMGVARDLLGYSYPLLGINIGHLGFLTEISRDSLEASVQKLKKDEFFIEKRMLITGRVMSHENPDYVDVACNDIVFGRMGQSQLTVINLYVNGSLLYTYNADGLIISTPSGSTAYNLSAGGPIIEPTATAFVVTPICSHVLGLRSIVLSAEDALDVEIAEQIRHSELAVGVTYDGEPMYELKTGDRVHITKSAESIRLLKLSKESFLKSLREKMKTY